MKLLFLNSLRGLKNKKIQAISIILLVMLSTCVYTAMQSSLDRLETGYYNYLDNQNVEHISVDYKIDYRKDIKKEDYKYLLENNFKDVTSEEKEILDIYDLNLDGLVDPFENQSFEYILDGIFQKYDADIYIKSKKIGELKDKYNFDFELERSKSIKVDDTYIRVLPYDEDKNINKLYLIEGSKPKNAKEITMLPKYAKHHNIKIGDYYKIKGEKYKIVGFAYAPDYIYPLVSYSALVFDEKKNNIIYTYKEDYKKINGVEEKIYSILYHGNVKREFDFEEMMKEKNSAKDDDVTKILYSKTNVDANAISSTRMGRIASLQLEFKTDRLFADYFMYLLLGISVFVITIIVRKRIKDEKMQIGILKSLGYKSYSIAVSYLVYPIVGGILGGIIGYVIGNIISIPVATLYLSYFLVPLKGISISYKYLINSIVIPTLFLSIVSYILSIFMLRKKPLYLLREGSNLKVNMFSKLVNKVTRILPFDYRFKYSLAFRSLPKLIVVAITSFLTGMLIVLTLIGMNLTNNLIEETFKGFKYDYMIYTTTPLLEKIDDTSDYILNGSFKIKEVKNGDKTKKLKDNISLDLVGIDLDSKYIEVKNNNENLIDKLEDLEGIIINENISKNNNIEIGDTVILKLDDKSNKTISYKVIGICSEYMGTNSYVNRLGFSKKLGYDKAYYTSMFSKDKRYEHFENLDDNISKNIAVVFNFKDMKDNIVESLDKYNTTIYLVILFASVMAFVIIAVIADIVVEENKRIISLMKVMGYSNKKISRVVLNIYTPIIILSYLLSIKAMTSLLSYILKVLADDINMVIPVNLSMPMAILGLVSLLVAYYIAIFISKRTLNKIPLSVAIKRD